MSPGLMCQAVILDGASNNCSIYIKNHYNIYFLHGVHTWQSKEMATTLCKYLNVMSINPN